MMGNLFFRRATPTELEAMTWSQLRYWNDWHDLMVEAEEKARAESAGKDGGFK